MPKKKMTSTTIKLKIAVFTETFLPKIDGIVSILCLMLQRLNEQGHQVLLFGPPGGPAEYAGAEIVGVGGPRLPLYPELHINIPRRFVWEKVKAFEPDVIHVVNPFFLGPFGMSYARRLRVPVLLRRARMAERTDCARDCTSCVMTSPAAMLPPKVASGWRLVNSRASAIMSESSLSTT